MPMGEGGRGEFMGEGGGREYGGGEMDGGRPGMYSEFGA